MKSQGSSLSGSQSLHEQPAKGLAGFQEALTVTSHRTEMPRQNSDPTSENPPLPPRIEKFDRSSWLRQEEDIPPKVTQPLLTFSTSELSPSGKAEWAGLSPPRGCISSGRVCRTCWELQNSCKTALPSSKESSRAQTEAKAN